MHPPIEEDAGDVVLQGALSNLEREIQSLHGRLDHGLQRWTTHLTRARANGPHKLQRGTRIRTADDITRQMKALHEQIEAYNVRIRAIRERGVDHVEITIVQLVDPDDTAPSSTELASSFMRRLIVSARLALHVHSAGLRKLEDSITIAFGVVKRMATDITRTFEEARSSADTCLWGLRNDVEGMALMLKAAMGRMGMKMARQRIIYEFFAKLDLEGTAGGTAGAVQMGSTAVHEENGIDDAQDRKAGRDDNESMTDASDVCGRVEMCQTCITDYFGRTLAR